MLADNRIYAAQTVIRYHLNSTAGVYFFSMLMDENNIARYFVAMLTENLCSDE